MRIPRSWAPRVYVRISCVATRTYTRTHAHTRAHTRADTHGRTNGQMYEFAPVNAAAVAAMNTRGTRSRTSSVRVEGPRAEGPRPPSTVHRPPAAWRDAVHIVVRSAAVGMCTLLSRVTSDDTDASPRARQRAHHLLHALRYLQATTCPVHPVEYLHIHYIPRALSNRGSVIVEGARAPIIGRVAMNMFFVDLSHAPTARSGSKLILIGCSDDVEVTANDWAALCDTINYEIVTRLPPTLTRVYE